jgi:signal transduction histidine kinase
MKAKNILLSFVKIGNTPRYVIILLVILLIGYIDYIAPAELSLRFFYLIPLFLAAWDKNGFKTGLIFSLISSIVNFYSDYLMGDIKYTGFYFIWEFIIRWGFFATIAFIIYKIKMYSDQLEENNLMLNYFNNVNNELIRIASHDLKNPLYNIMCMSSLIRDSEDISRNQIVQYNNWIYESCERMNHIINEYLNAHKPEQIRITTSIKDVAINKLMERLVNFYQYRATVKKIVINMSIPDADIHVLADEVHAYQVLDNILSNAIKYSPVGKQVWIELIEDNSSEKNQGKIIIKIKDEGPGFTEEDLSKLYSKDTRLSAVPTGGESTTGNGLYIAKRLCEEMNSEIRCESIYRTGATFFISFPKAQ